MNFRSKPCLLGAAVLFAIFFAASAKASAVVVVAANSNIVRLTAKQIANIYLGKNSTFPDGRNAVPFDQPTGSAVRNEFYAKVVNKNAAQMTAYWAKIIFTGDGRPPKMRANDEEVRKAIVQESGGIGYIDSTAVDSTVRVVLIP